MTRNTALNDQEKAALYGYLCRQERDALAEREAAEAKRKENFKKGKEWGFSKEEIAFFEKARKAGDGSSIVKKWELHKIVLIKLGLIPDAQGGDLLSDRADRLQLIRAKGEADGLVGVGGAGSSNYAGGSDEDRTYMDGWHSGQQIYLLNWQAAMEKAIASRTNEEPASDGDPFPQAAE